MQESAEHYGADLTATHGRLPTQRDVTDQYLAAIDEWLWERPDRPDADDCDAQGDLESALSDIGGVAEVLMELGVKDEVSGYLGGQLREHYDTAMDAFSRIFKLGEYKTEAT
jgi:hypothetical protein